MLVSVLIFGMCAVGITASATDGDTVGNYKFNITSTYKDVDWQNWKPYKAETHVHTVRSDASTEVDDMIEYYYGFGFDAMALTDHGTVNYGWTSGQNRIAIFDYQFFVYGALDEPSKERYTEITTGTGAVEGGSAPRGYGMREIPMGIELNGMSAKKCHINGFYADYGHGDLGLAVTWPRDAVEGNYKAGGLTHINHVGEWTDGKDDISTYDSEFIADFASIYSDYGIMRKNRDENNLRGCLGMELVNTADSRTKNDRYLYDEILKILAPQGINVLGFCEDDAHELSDCDRNAQYFLMPSNDMATNNIKHAMMYGQFYASSKNSKNSYELGSGFNAVGPYPSVSYIGVDDAKNQIIITSKDANKIRMVADGEIIETDDISTGGATTVLDLNKYENKINSYVRVYLTGPGGITYLQPFLVEKEVAPVSTVTFNKPSSDTDVKVFNAAGSLVPPVNSDGVYVLDAGDYTYIASRPGYITTEPVPFTVSQAEIDAGRQRVIDVSLEKNEFVVDTTFYVPETIYLSETDATTFKYYVDRANVPDGALNTSSTTGNVYFSRPDATDITISYESVDGVSVGSMAIGQTHSDSNTLSTLITSGAMTSAVPTGASSVIKWTATYKCGGKTMQSNAYTYIYRQLTGSGSTLAAGGMARTKKNVLSWAHTTMDITATVWMTGVHSVSGGTNSYKFTPAGGAALTPAQDVGNIVVAGVGMGTASDESSGGSKEINPVGGTGTITIDTSRYNNLSQIPGLIVGLDVNDCSQGENSSESYVDVGGTRIFYTTATISSSTSGTRIFSSGINMPVDQNVPSLLVKGQASCNKESRTDKVVGSFTLNLKYVSKSVLRDQYNNAISYAYQPDWFTDTNEYYDYVKAIKNAAVVLGNPAATANDVTNATNSLLAELGEVELKKGQFTVNHINSLTNEVIKSDTSEFTVSDTIIGSAEEFTGYEYDGAWNCTSGKTAVAEGGNTFGAVTAYDDSYTMNFYYSPVEYSVQYVISGSEIAENPATALYGQQFKVASVVPVQQGYRFDGWYLDADGKIYQPGDSILWNFDTDSSLTPVWTPETYTATYDLDGGTGLDTLTETVSYMDSFSITTVIPEKDGAAFAGWLATTQSGDELGTFTSGSTISWDVADSITLKAQWKVIDFEVALDADGGTLSTDKITVTYGSEYGTLPVPVKAGYNFDGWYLDEGFTTPVTASTVVNVTENHTLYAKWSKGEYKITYYLNNQFYAETTCNYGDTIVPEAAPEAEGYTFSGWSAIPSTMPDKDVTVTGTLTINSYKLTFVLDDETILEKTVKYGADITAPQVEEKEGYTFSGWVDLPSTMPAEDSVVTGSYTANTYTLYYYVDGSERSNVKYAYGDTIVPLSMPSKTGYVFSGWDNLPETMPANNVYVYGTYDAVKYTLTYKVDGEIYEQVQYSYKDAITPLEAPIKEGYTFSGWSYIPATMPSRDYNVTGSFTANTYSYFFVVDGTYRSDLTIKAKFGEKITAPQIDVAENYTFSGWSPAFPETMGSESLYFYGTTSKAKSTVTFSLNGGTGTAPESAAYNVGETITLPSTGITKSGYTFAGWSENSEAQSGTFSYKVTEKDATLYAVWSAVNVRIEPAKDTNTVVDNIFSLIYGIKEMLTKSEFMSSFVDVIGDTANVKITEKLGFGTGTTVELFDGETAVKTYAIVVYGDVDGDGIADGQDVQIAELLSMGALTKANVGEAVYEAADCNHDGAITDADVQIIIESGLKMQTVDQSK